MFYSHTDALAFFTVANCCADTLFGWGNPSVQCSDQYTETWRVVPGETLGQFFMFLFCRCCSAFVSFEGHSKQLRCELKRTGGPLCGQALGSRSWISYSTNSAQQGHCTQHQSNYVALGHICSGLMFACPTAAILQRASPGQSCAEGESFSRLFPFGSQGPIRLDASGQN